MTNDDIVAILFVGPFCFVPFLMVVWVVRKFNERKDRIEETEEYQDYGYKNE